MERRIEVGKRRRMEMGRGIRYLLLGLIVCGLLIGLHFLRASLQNSLVVGGGSGPRNVYILTSSGLRPSHLSCYLYKSIQTPGIDFLAYDGVRFENAFSVSPDSLAAHLSLLTGLYPSNSRLKPLIVQLMKGVSHTATEGGAAGSAGPTLPQQLQDMGYATAAFLSDPDLRHPDYLAAQFREVEAGGPGLLSWQPACDPATLREHAIRWIEKHRGKEHMVLLNFSEPTLPFLPPSPYNLQYQRYPYDGEIAALDEQVGRFVHYLKRSGLFERSIIVFASPYGETLDDQVHSGSLDDSILRSAMMIAAPGLLPRMRSYESAASLADIYPTILQLLNVRPAGTFDGKPLFRKDSDREIEPREIPATTFVPTLFGFPEKSAVRTKEGQWIERENSAAALDPVIENPGRILDKVLMLAREDRKSEARALFSDYCRGKNASPSVNRLLSELGSLRPHKGRK
jgi:hypothetical protein